jgi:Tol biopolymer transport system component
MPFRRSGRLVVGYTISTLLLAQLLVVASADAQGQGQITFSSTRGDDESSHVFVMNADGSGERQLTSGVTIDVDPTFSPDGTKIAFTRAGLVRKRKADPGDIWSMNADGTGQQRLTRGARRADGQPAYSPDGTKIAFTRNRVAKDVSAVMVMDADGTNERRLASQGSFNGFPTWSGDGSKIAFTSDRTGNPEIFIMNADGSGQTQLTNDPAPDSKPALSHDGSRIAFISERAGSAQLYVMPAAGGSPRLLTNGEDWGEGNPSADYAPSWSVDDSEIIYTGDRDESWEIIRVPAGGGAQVPLTESPASDFAGEYETAPPGAAARAARAARAAASARAARAPSARSTAAATAASPASAAAAPRVLQSAPLTETGIWTGTPAGVAFLCGL